MNDTVKETTGKQRGGITGKGFMPGVCANPKGRPKDSLSLVTELKRVLRSRELKVADKNGITHIYKNPKELVVKRVILEAIAGDMQATKLCLQYIDGDPKQSIELKADIQTTETKINVDIQAKLEADPEAKAEFEKFTNRLAGITE